MTGLELSEKYYKQYGESLINNKFSSIKDKIAIGLVGQGSECIGFDDELSKDHDFDPGFIIFIPDDIDDKTIFELKKEYSYLPKEYLGYKRILESPLGGDRKGIIKLTEFLYMKTNTYDGNITKKQFLYIPEFDLLEVVNGRLFKDDSKVFTNIRIKLSYFPIDVKLKKIAGELFLMSQSGQYNVYRMLNRKDYSAAKLSLYEFVKSTIHLVFLINECYMPYYKWQFRMMKNLSWPTISNTSYNIEEQLLYLLNVDLSKEKESTINNTIKDIVSIFINRLQYEELTNKQDENLVVQAYQVNDKILDDEIRNMNILAGV